MVDGEAAFLSGRLSQAGALSFGRTYAIELRISLNYLLTFMRVTDSILTWQ